MGVRCCVHATSRQHSEARHIPPSDGGDCRRRTVGRRARRTSRPDDRGRRDVARARSLLLSGATCSRRRTATTWPGSTQSRAPSPSVSGQPCPQRRCAGTTAWSQTASPSSFRSLRSPSCPTSPAWRRCGPTSAITRCATPADPEQIGADKLWGPNFDTAGNGMKIGIIDDGLEATHPYFNPSGFQYPPGFPEGLTQYTTPKVIVQRVFTPAIADVEVREAAVRSGELVPRDARRRHRRRRTRRDRRRHNRSRASPRTRTSATTRRSRSRRRTSASTATARRSQRRSRRRCRTG